MRRLQCRLLFMAGQLLYLGASLHRIPRPAKAVAVSQPAEAIGVTPLPAFPFAAAVPLFGSLPFVESVNNRTPRNRIPIVAVGYDGLSQVARPSTVTRLKVQTRQLPADNALNIGPC
ncbi:MAG: hypothetical protein M5U25_09535 [Planctomycetota bacterium]|nr:hypothetical protein [Planctomycetota bacterium]